VGGLCTGVSFGLGEALFVAYAVAQNPAYAYLPWYAYTGYFSERLMACFAHGVLTAVLVIGMQREGGSSGLVFSPRWLCTFF